MELKVFKSIVLCCTLLVSALFASGCKPSDQSEQVMKQLKKMELDYLVANKDQARSILKQEISLVEDSKVVRPRLQAGALFIICGRLYVLEKNCGDNIASDLAYVKVRYWNLRRYELAGPITQEDLAEYLSCTPERVSEIIEKLDKGRNHGHLPKYRQTQ